MTSQVQMSETEAIIQEAVRRLIEAAHPTQIILFGSYARGEQNKDSDLDLLVIVPNVTNRHDEMVRLRRSLARLPVPIDVVVYSMDEVEKRRALKGTMLNHALREGRVLHASA